jgi:hypothetical protein
MSNYILVVDGATNLVSSSSSFSSIDIGGLQTSNVQMHTLGASRFFLGSNGFLGLGTTQPEYPLHVSHGPIFSGAQNGTPPFVVASSTKVANLNADMLDGAPSSFYRDAGNLTAGTLSVARGGTGSVTLASNKVLVGNGSNGILAPDALHFDTVTGRLGLGTASPSSILDVVGDVTVSSNIIVAGSNLRNVIDSKQPVLTGAASSIASNNLLASRALLSDANGKVGVSTATSTELGFLSGTTSGVQTQLNAKQAIITGAASTIASNNLLSARALVSDGIGKVGVSAVTSTELGHLTGVTSGVQTQLNTKQATITGAVSTLTNSNLTASRALLSDANGKIDVSPVTSTELGHLTGVTSGVQTQLNTKQATITGAVSTLTNSNLTASRALLSDANGKIDVSPVTSTELEFLSGVTSGVQTQLNGKQAIITGAASTITTNNLVSFRALSTDTNGKVSTSAVTSTELSHLSGVTSGVQSQLNGKVSKTGDSMTGPLSVTGDITSSASLALSTGGISGRIGIAAAANSFAGGTNAGDIVMRTDNSTNRIFIRNNGDFSTPGITVQGNRVGIATANPSSTHVLDVNGASITRGLLTATAGATVTGTLTANSGVTVAGTLTANSGVTVAGTLSTNGTLSINSSVSTPTGAGITGPIRMQTGFYPDQFTGTQLNPHQTANGLVLAGHFYGGQMVMCRGDDTSQYWRLFANCQTGLGGPDYNVYMTTLSGGTYSESRKLRLQGNGDLTISGANATKSGGSTSWITTSDERVKKNIQPFTKGLAEVLQIQPVSFQYNGNGETIDDGKVYTGIIAQKIQEVLPEAVSYRRVKLHPSDVEETDILQYDSDPLLYVLLNAVRELRAEIDELKAAKQ